MSLQQRIKEIQKIATESKDNKEMKQRFVLRRAEQAKQPDVWEKIKNFKPSF